MDATTLYRNAVGSWTRRLDALSADDLDRPTPCSAWTVRDLVNHVVGEERWTAPLLEGQTIAQVGDRFDGDLLGGDPVAVARDAAREALDVVPDGGAGVAGLKVHLSYGDEDAAEYLLQLAADHLIHGWDLAAATGGDTRLEPELVTEVAAWFADREALYRSAGAVGPRGTSDGDPQSELLAAAGRAADWGPTHALLASFGSAFGRGDLEAAMSMVTDDIVFESTSPAPDGLRSEGREAVREVWRTVLATPGLRFTEEETVVCADRALVRWRFEWTGDDGSPGHVRGVDVIRVRDGKVCEKLSYVKG